jgi:FSR family fosmidomycin resistance protein-like MFS transporter
MSKKLKSQFKLIRVTEISLAHFIHDIYASILAPVLPIIIEKLGVSYFLAGLLSVMGRLPSVFNPIIGLIADRKEIRYFIILTPAITAISMSLIGLADNYIILLVLLSIMGWSSAFFHVPAPVLIRRLSGDKKGLGMSFYMVAGELARGFAPILIVSAISWWTFEGTWRIMPLGLFASAILYFRLRKLKDIEITQKASYKGAFKFFIKLFPFFSVISAYIFIRGIVRALLVTFLPTYLTSEGSTLFSAAAALSVVEFSGAAGTLAAGALSDKIGRRNTLLLIAVLLPVFVFFFIQTSGIVSIIMLGFSGFVLFGASPVLLALINDIESNRQNFVNGTYMAINFAVAALSMLLVGSLSDLIGLDKMFEYLPYFALAIIPAALLLKDKK